MEYNINISILENLSVLDLTFLEIAGLFAVKNLVKLKIKSWWFENCKVLQFWKRRPHLDKTIFGDFLAIF